MLRVTQRLDLKKFFCQTVVNRSSRNMGGRASFPIVKIPKDHIFVVTGANTGLGFEIAKWSAMMGATVILACRSEERARQAMARMQDEFESEKAKGTSNLADYSTLALEFMQLDLASFQSVVEFCEAFKKSGRLLHVLFCNAGLGFGPYKQSTDGLEMMLQVNYLSHFVMIAKLLPIMLHSGQDCRIILMASRAHKRSRFDIQTMNYTGSASSFPGLDYYGRSKLYQIMQTYTMSKRLKDSNITINCMHPGVVETELWRDIESPFVKFFINASKTLGTLRNSFQGAVTGIDLATNPKHAGISGHYWVDCSVATPTSTARDEQKQALLWKATFPFIKQYLTDEEIAGLGGY